MNSKLSKFKQRQKLRTASGKQFTGTPTETSIDSKVGLNHELNAFKIELELQNAELKRTCLALEKSKQRYQNLYDIAPVGYLTLSAEGKIIEANLTAASMLGVDHKTLLNRNFSGWVAPEDGNSWYLLFNRVLQDEEELENCEVMLKRGDGNFFARLDCRPVMGGDQTLTLHTTLTDITEHKRAENAIRESEARLDFALQNSLIGAWEMDLEDHITQRSLMHDRIYGYETMLPRWTYEMFLEHVLPQDRSRVDRIFHEAVATKVGWSFEFRIRRADGEVRWIYAAGGHLHKTSIKPERVSGIVQDITERKQSETRLKLAASVFNHTREGIVITDAEGTILEVNNAFTHITGYQSEEVLGHNLHILKSGAHDSEFYDTLWQGLNDKGYWYGEISNRRKNGEVYTELITISALLDASGQTQNYVALFSDITRMKDREQQLEHIAHYDALTSLPNRVLLADRLQQAMIQSQRRNQPLAVAYLDLDGFKAVNDAFGHEIGDELLIGVSQRMKEALREGDTLARIGGDEFVAVLVDLEQRTNCETVLARLLQAAADPVTVGNTILQVSASIGVALYPQDGAVADQLMRRADQSMYIAKQSGKNRYHLFDADHDAAMQTQSEGLKQIRRALELREFVLYYQPKVNMKTGEVIGAEAFIRWQHPERGLVSPADFLPIIENHPISVELGEWVINTALTQMSEWHAAGLDIPVSVNIGVRQLQQADFVARVSTLLAAHPDIQPGCLELEVLETSALTDIAAVSAKVQACRDMGVRFVLDDFGTAYSSLTYLKHLPVEMLKIDQSFVCDMLDDPDDLAIVQGVIGLATAFHRNVIAECVETVAQGTKLLSMGCELGQGYGIARPMAAADLPNWVANWKQDAAWRA